MIELKLPSQLIRDNGLGRIREKAPYVFPLKNQSHAATAGPDDIGRIMENVPAEPQAATDRLYSSEEQKDGDWEAMVV